MAFILAFIAPIVFAYGLDLAGQSNHVKAAFSVTHLAGICKTARNYSVRDFGAAGDGATMDTAAIQRAIDTAHAAGGGRVTVPPGIYLAGTVQLRSHVELHLEKGAVLKGCTSESGYNRNDAFPENFWSQDEEWSGGHLLLGYKVENVAITGEGKIDGSGLSFFGECDEDSRFPGYKYGLRLHPLDRTWFRPGPLVAFFLSKDIRLEGVSVVDSPCWTTHFRCCNGVSIRNVTICNDRTVANTDGFSIDCSSNVKVSKCTVVTGDDAVAIRASCKLHADKNPCEHIWVEDCDFSSCAMGVRIGIGTGTIRDVNITRCVVREAARGIKFHAAWRPFRKKGCCIEGVRITDCQILECDNPVRTVGGAGDWRVRNVTFENCRFSSLSPVSLADDGGRHPENITFRNCTREYLDRLKVRHHWGYGDDRSRKFIEVDGEVVNLQIENCLADEVP